MEVKKKCYKIQKKYFKKEFYVLIFVTEIIKNILKFSPIYVKNWTYILLMFSKIYI